MKRNYKLGETTNSEKVYIGKMPLEWHLYKVA